MARDYSADVRRQKRLERKLKGYLSFAGCVVAILLVSWVITKVIDYNKKPDPVELPQQETGVVTEILAPLPMQENGDDGLVQAEFGPVKQEGSFTLTAWDAKTMRLPQRGQVNLEYFSDAAFVGDSLTTGFIDYKTNLGGAIICAYRGIGPDSIVKRSALNHSERGAEVPLTVLAAKKPGKIYVLLGSNSLTIQGNEDSFLAYYGQMLDELKKTMQPGGTIYVQSIPPVRPGVTEIKPGLEKGRIQAVNERLAALAEEKGCVYIDLWEVLADENGDLRAECAAPDGIHLTAGNGYGAWADYLRKHTRYNASNPWTPGTAFYVEEKPEEKTAPESEPAADAAPEGKPAE